MFLRSMSLFGLSPLGLVADVSAQTQPARVGRTSAPAWFSHALGAGEGTDGISGRGWLEMGAVGLTGAGHLSFSVLDQSRLFIPVATLGWGAYVVYRARTDRRFLGRLGLTSTNLGGNVAPNTHQPSEQ